MRDRLAVEVVACGTWSFLDGCRVADVLNDYLRTRQLRQLWDF